MQREEALRCLKAGAQGVATWNAWKRAHPNQRVELTNALLAGCDLRGVDLSGAACQGSHFGRANLARAVLRKCQFAAVHLEGAQLERADFEGANLQKAQLCGAQLSGAYLQSTNLTHARLDGADLRGAYLGAANLKGASLCGADLRGAHLQGAQLAGAQLSGADLRHVDLKDAHIVGAHIEGAIRRGPTDADDGHSQSHDLAVALRVQGAPELATRDFVELFQRFDDLGTTLLRVVAAAESWISPVHRLANEAIGMGGEAALTGVEGLSRANASYHAWLRAHETTEDGRYAGGAAGDVPLRISELLRVGNIEHKDGALLELVVRRGHPFEPLLTKVCRAIVDVWDRELAAHRKRAARSGGPRPPGPTKPSKPRSEHVQVWNRDLVAREGRARTGGPSTTSPASGTWAEEASPYASLMNKPGVMAGSSAGPSDASRSRLEAGVRSFFAEPEPAVEDGGLPFIAPRDDMPAQPGSRSHRVQSPPEFAPGHSDYIEGPPPELPVSEPPPQIGRPGSPSAGTPEAVAQPVADSPRPPAENFTRILAAKALETRLTGRGAQLRETLVAEVIERLTPVVVALWRSPAVRHLQQPAAARSEHARGGASSFSGGRSSQPQPPTTGFESRRPRNPSSRLR